MQLCSLGADTQKHGWPPFGDCGGTEQHRRSNFQFPVGGLVYQPGKLGQAQIGSRQLRLACPK